MKENLMNSAHKATNAKYREGWDRIYKYKTKIITCRACGNPFLKDNDKTCPKCNAEKYWFSITEY